jgi:chromosome segregation ATPase
MAIPTLLENQVARSYTPSSSRSSDDGIDRMTRVATEALHSLGQGLSSEERACLVREAKCLRVQRNNIKVLLRERTLDLKEASEKLDAMTVEINSGKNGNLELSESKNILEQEKLCLEAENQSLRNEIEQLKREKGQLTEDLSRSRQDCRDSDRALREEEEKHRVSSQSAVRGKATLESKVLLLEQNEVGLLREIEQLKAQLRSQNMSSARDASLRKGPGRSGPPSRK